MVASNLIATLTGYGYSDSSTQTPAAWFANQTVALQLTIAKEIFDSNLYFVISAAFATLQLNVNLNQTVIDQMATYYEAAYMSIYPKDTSALEWFVAQNYAAQSVVIDRMCTDWQDWAPTLIRDYSLLAVNSPVALSSAIISRMDQCPPVTTYKDTLQFGQNLYIGFLSFAVLLLVAFLLFVVYFVPPNTERNWKTIGTPFNIGFFFGLLAILGNDIAFVAFYAQGLSDIYSIYDAQAGLWFSSDAVRNFLSLIIEICQAIWSISYLFFSFKRSEPQIKYIFLKFHKIIRYAFLFSPVLILCPIPLGIAQIIQPTMAWGQLNYIPQAVSVSAMVVLDLIFLFSFMSFLARTRVDRTTAIEPKFLIVSRFGFVSSGITIAIGAMTGIIIHEQLNATYDFMVKYTSLICGLMHAVMIIMVLLKIALYYVSLDEIKKLTKRLESSNKHSKMSGKSQFGIFSNRPANQVSVVNFVESIGTVGEAPPSFRYPPSFASPNSPDTIGTPEFPPERLIGGVLERILTPEIAENRPHDIVSYFVNE